MLGYDYIIGEEKAGNWKKSSGKMQEEEEAVVSRTMVSRAVVSSPVVRCMDRRLVVVRRMRRTENRDVVRCRKRRKQW